MVSQNCFSLLFGVFRVNLNFHNKHIIRITLCLDWQYHFYPNFYIQFLKQIIRNSHARVRGICNFFPTSVTVPWAESGTGIFKNADLVILDSILLLVAARFTPTSKTSYTKLELPCIWTKTYWSVSLTNIVWFGIPTPPKDQLRATT